MSQSELQLQAACFQWAWNTQPLTRGHLWHVTNEVKPWPGETVEQFKGGDVFRTLIRVDAFRHKSYEELYHLYGYKGESPKALSMRIAKMKAAGLVPGVYDLHFFWRDTLHIFELKVDYNKLSAEQVQWGEAMIRHGAKAYLCYDIETFQYHFLHILNTPK